VALDLVIGLGVVAFLLLYFSLNLDKDHFLLKLLLIFFFLITIMLIPKAAINDDCSLVPVNQTENTTMANYTEITRTYDTLCTSEKSETETSFLKITMWLFRLFGIYFFVYIFYHWAKKSEKLCETMERMKRQFK